MPESVGCQHQPKPRTEQKRPERYMRLLQHSLHQQARPSLNRTVPRIMQPGAVTFGTRLSKCRCCCDPSSSTTHRRLFNEHMIGTDFAACGGFADTNSDDWAMTRGKWSRFGSLQILGLQPVSASPLFQASEVNHASLIGLDNLHTCVRWPHSVTGPDHSEDSLFVVPHLLNSYHVATWSRWLLLMAYIRREPFSRQSNRFRQHAPPSEK
jgi:hypothetical protein